MHANTHMHISQQKSLHYLRLVHGNISRVFYTEEGFKHIGLSTKRYPQNLNVLFTEEKEKNIYLYYSQ